MKNLDRNKYLFIQFDRNIHLADFESCEIVELNENTICNQFYFHGYCKKLLKHQCHKNHDFKRIFCFKKQKINKIKSEKNIEFVQKEDNSDAKFEKFMIKHNAGIDAFMTGYVMLYLTGKISNFEFQSNKHQGIPNINLENFRDINFFNFNIYLSGKDFPLVIQKSKFHSISIQHKEKKQKLEKQ